MSTQVLTQEGLNRSAQLIMADISHTAVGTGTNAAVITDSQLQTETNRLATLKTIRDANILQHRVFFLNSQMPAPDVKEAGWFMNGTIAADSGEILARSQFTFTKGTQDLLLIIEMSIQESATGT